MTEHPFTDEEIALIAEFAGISEDKVRGVAWLTAMKAKEASREAGDRMMVDIARSLHNDGQEG